MTSTNWLHKYIDILKVVDHSNLRNCLIGHRAMNHDGDYKLNSVYDNLKNKRKISERNMRDKFKYEVGVKNDCKNSMISENVAVLWNSLPPTLREISQRERFKESTKKFVIQGY